MSTARVTAAEAAAQGLDLTRLPHHVAMIMDGNGRWARRRGWRRTRGHEAGADVVRAITTEAARLGIQQLTLYAFSSENWDRPEREVSFLMRLLGDYLDQELETLHNDEIRMTAIGRLTRLPAEVKAKLDRNIAETAGYRRMTLCLALSYGGRAELVDACRRLAERIAAGTLMPDEIDEAALASVLYDAAAPDVDVVIRTAGEQRVSNFLPWQAAYAEYISMEPFWPEFSVADFHEAMRIFQRRERRFGRSEGE